MVGNFRHAQATLTFTCERALDGCFWGCRSFSDIDMGNVLLNHREHHCYYNPVGVQDINHEDDEATSHPIDRSIRCSGESRDCLRRHLGAEGGRRQYALRRRRARYQEGTYLWFLLLCRMCVLQEANDCRRPRQSSVRRTCMCERQHLLRCQSMLRRVGHGSFYVVDLIGPVYGRSVSCRWKELSLRHESMHMYKLNTLVGKRVSLTIKKSKQNGYTNYNVTHLEVFH